MSDSAKASPLSEAGAAHFHGVVIRRICKSFAPGDSEFSLKGGETRQSRAVWHGKISEFYTSESLWEKAHQNCIKT